MINGFYAAKSGVRVFQTSLDITANNIANVNTQGYKAQTASFTDLMYTNAQGQNVLTGSGSRVTATSVDMAQGGSQPDQERCASIQGEGFFAVRDDAGNLAYTREGNFSVSVTGNQAYLTLPGGRFALDQGGNRIQVTNGDVNTAMYQAALYSFANPSALAALGDGRFAPTGASGAAALDNQSSLIVDASEQSNVDLSEEMTRLMIAQRGMQFNLRMLQTADEVEQMVNNLR